MDLAQVVTVNGDGAGRVWLADGKVCRMMKEVLLVGRLEQVEPDCLGLPQYCNWKVFTCTQESKRSVSQATNQSTESTLNSRLNKPKIILVQAAKLIKFTYTNPSAHKFPARRNV